VSPVMRKREKIFSERQLISKIRGLVGNRGQEVIRGIGDDCAVVRKDPDRFWLITTDTLVESIHFDFAWHPPHLLGRKTLSVNISDVAAMGGQPLFAQLSLAMPDLAKADWLDDYWDGFAAVLQEHGIHLIGGDTVKSKNDVVFTVTVIGEVAKDQVVYRSGAVPGDRIWVSGPLGEAAAGLELCRRYGHLTSSLPKKWQQAIKIHLDPEPQVKISRLLAENHMLHSMIDLSDGLATDLAHLCAESEVSAEIIGNNLPISDLLIELAASFEVSAVDLALKGGEDYQLLFTSAPEVETRLQKMVFNLTGRELYCIGRIVAGEGVFFCNEHGRRMEISYQGYDHFSHIE